MVFAAKGAAIFQGASLFRTTDFEPTPFQNNGLGTQYPPRGAWRDGQRPAGFDGRVSCSTFLPAWWREGIPDSVTVPVPRMPNGLPICCAPAIAGLQFGGKAKVRTWRLQGPPSGMEFNGSAEVTSGTSTEGGIEFSGSAFVIHS